MLLTDAGLDGLEHGILRQHAGLPHRPLSLKYTIDTPRARAVMLGDKLPVRLGVSYVGREAQPPQHRALYDLFGAY